MMIKAIGCRRASIPVPVRFGEFLHRSPEGQESWTRVSGVPLRDSHGQVSGALSVIVDIDEIKRSEKHQQLLINELKLAMPWPIS